MSRREGVGGWVVARGMSRKGTASSGEEEEEEEEEEKRVEGRRTQWQLVGVV